MAGGLSSGAGDWAAGRPPTGQLEGPGMPVERSSSHPASAIAGPTTLGSTSLGAGAMQVVASADAGDPDGDADDRTYCFCDGISYGEMIACDENSCEREWVCAVFPFLLVEVVDISSFSSIVSSCLYRPYCSSRWEVVLRNLQC
jgi:hypothetical protein